MSNSISTAPSFEINPGYSKYLNDTAQKIQKVEAYALGFQNLKNILPGIIHQPEYKAAEATFTLFSSPKDAKDNLDRKWINIQAQLPNVIGALTKSIPENARDILSKQKDNIHRQTENILHKHSAYGDHNIIDTVLREKMPFWRSEKTKDSFRAGIYKLANEVAVINELRQELQARIDANPNHKIEETALYISILVKAHFANSSNLVRIKEDAEILWPDNIKYQSFGWNINWNKVLNPNSR